MSVGLSGESIGLGAANPNPIGGATLVKTDGATTSRGCLENFIGYGRTLESVEPLPEDFSVAKNTVTEARSGAAAVQEPAYSAVGLPLPYEKLSWVTPTP
jgi:hypothetical protein